MTKYGVSEYATGYGKPPLSKRFPKGKSDNRRGCPRVAAITCLGQLVAIREGGVERRVGASPGAIGRKASYRRTAERGRQCNKDAVEGTVATMVGGSSVMSHLLALTELILVTARSQKFPCPECFPMLGSLTRLFPNVGAPRGCCPPGPPSRAGSSASSSDRRPVMEGVRGAEPSLEKSRAANGLSRHRHITTHPGGPHHFRTHR